MPTVDSRLRDKPVPKISVEKMESECSTRLKALKGSDLAFLDQRLPAYKREIINIIGTGVTENTTDPNLVPKIKTAAHGFALVYVRASKGGGAAMHRHATEEVFISVKGQWAVNWLEDDTERQIILNCGDICSVPIGVFRGFRNVGDEPDSLLIALVGGPDAGKVDWHPTVIEEARKTGLSVDDDGNLVIADQAAS
jgi:mannose-6-phosphate isomerase-like protein (cupin superfamily)